MCCFIMLVGEEVIYVFVRATRYEVETCINLTGWANVTCWGYVDFKDMVFFFL